MKKYLSLLLIAVFGFLIVSCNDDNADNDTYSVVYDITRDFQYDATDGYYINETFNTALYDSDVVLIYRMVGATNGAPIWQQIPNTLYLDNGEEVDYEFDFSKYDIQIYAGGTYDLSTTPEYIVNQRFRVVIVPASQGKNASVDHSDYNSVIKHYNIDDSNPTKL